MQYGLRITLVGEATIGIRIAAAQVSVCIVCPYSCIFGRRNRHSNASVLYNFSPILRLEIFSSNHKWNIVTLHITNKPLKT